MNRVRCGVQPFSTHAHAPTRHFVQSEESVEYNNKNQ
jgi:hypothetical protein